MRFRKIRLLVSTGFLFVTANSSWACPFCNTETGKQIRQSIFGPDFGFNALLTLAPVPIVLALTFLITKLLPDKFSQKEDASHERK